MPTARPFAYNTGSQITGTTQVGNLAVGYPTSGFAATGLQWWNGPDEDLGYVIAASVPGGNQPTPTPGGSYVGFWRSGELSEQSFVSLTNSIFGQSFSDGASAKTYLNSNGYWTSFSPSTLLLDLYPNASVAYSLRKLRNAYSGSAIRVRRASDNVEQDIGFSGNDLDTSSLALFCSGTNGFIATWYDQSTNSNNSTQSTAASQAQIVSSGNLITDPISGKISSLWTNDLYVLGSSITMTQTNFRLGVFNRSASGTRIYGVGTTSSTPYIGRWDASNAITSSYGTGTATHSASNTSTGKLMMTVLRDSSNNVKCWLNNTALTTGTSSGNASPITHFGAYSTVTTAGYKQEEVYWASDQESNRTGIETNANNYWTIY